MPPPTPATIPSAAAQFTAFAYQPVVTSGKRFFHGLGEGDGLGVGAGVGLGEGLGDGLGVTAGTGANPAFTVTSMPGILKVYLPFFSVSSTVLFWLSVTVTLSS